RFKADATGTAAFDHPVWARFTAVAGDGKASRQLFAAVIDDPDRARLLARVVEDPKQAGDAYAAEVVRLSDRVRAAQKRREEGKPADGGTLAPGEFAGFLFLGTFDQTEYRPDPVADPVAHLREWLLFNTTPHWH